MIPYDKIAITGLRYPSSDDYVQSEIREKLSSWMIEHSFSTGHGDSINDLLDELSWQVRELQDRSMREGY